MAAATRILQVTLLVLTALATSLALVPRFYHRWWWWDVLMHGLIAGILAVWGRLHDVPPRWAWPALVAGMLGWEWLELAVPVLFSPTRTDVLKDLTVNVVAFGTVQALLDRDAPVVESVRSIAADRGS